MSKPTPSKAEKQTANSRADYFKKRRDKLKIKEEVKEESHSIVFTLADRLLNLIDRGIVAYEKRTISWAGLGGAAPVVSSGAVPPGAWESVPVPVVAVAAPNPVSGTALPPARPGLPPLKEAWEVESTEPIFTKAAELSEAQLNTEVDALRTQLEAVPNSLIEMARYNAYMDDPANDFQKTAQLHRALLRRLGITIPRDAVPVVTVP